MEQIRSIEEFEALRERLIAAVDRSQTLVTVCGGSGCLANGSEKVADKLREALAVENLSSRVQMKKTGCHGFCERGPIVVIEPEGLLYQGVGKSDLETDVKDIVAALRDGAEPVKRLLYKDPITKEVVSHYSDTSR